MKKIRAGEVRVGDTLHTKAHGNVVVSEVVSNQVYGEHGSLREDHRMVLLRIDDPFHWWSLPKDVELDLVKMAMDHS